MRNVLAFHHGSVQSSFKIAQPIPHPPLISRDCSAAWHLSPLGNDATWMSLSKIHFIHIMLLPRFNFSLIPCNYLTNAHHQTLAWNIKTWLWVLPQTITDVSVPLATEERSRSDQECRVDAIFRASSKIWYKWHNLSIALQMPLQGLQYKSTKIFAYRSLFEAQLLNGFQYGAKVGKVNKAFN